MKRSLFPSAAAAAGALLCLSAPMEADAAPAYRVPLEVSGYAGEVPLTNFPVLVRISESGIDDFSY